MSIKSSKVLLFTTLMSMSSFSWAETQIGLGTGAVFNFSSVSSVVSVPIKLHSSFMIEPFFGFSERKQDSDQNSSDYTDLDSSARSIGISFFSNLAEKNNFTTYFGVSFLISEIESRAENAITYFNGVNTVTDTYYHDLDQTIYTINPLIGISYNVNERLAFSIESGVAYRWGDEESTTESSNSSSGPESEKAETTYTASTSRLLFRFFF